MTPAHVHQIANVVGWLARCAIFLVVAVCAVGALAMARERRRGG